MGERKTRGKNVMREIGISMGTWYLLTCLRDPPRQRRQKFFLLRIELALDFPEEERMMQHSSVSISLGF